MIDHAQELGAEFGFSAAEVRMLLRAASKTDTCRQGWIDLAAFSLGDQDGKLTLNFLNGCLTGRPEQWRRV